MATSKTLTPIVNNKQTDKEKFQEQLRQILNNPDFDEAALTDAINAYRESIIGAQYILQDGEYLINSPDTRMHGMPAFIGRDPDEAAKMVNEETFAEINEAIRETLQQYAEDNGYSISMDENGIGGINVENIDDFLRDCDRTDFVNCGKNAAEAAEERDKYGKPLSDEEFQQKIKDALSDPDFDREAFDAMIKEQEQRLVEKAQLDAVNEDKPDFIFNPIAVKQQDPKNAIYRPDVPGVESVPTLSSGDREAIEKSAKDNINRNIEAALRDYAVENGIPYSKGENGISSVTMDNIGDFIERGNRDDFTKCTPIPEAEPSVPGHESEPSDGVSGSDGKEESGKMQTIWGSVTSNPTVKAIADKIKEIGGKIKDWAQSKFVVDKAAQAEAKLGNFDDKAVEAPGVELDD